MDKGLLDREKELYAAYVAEHDTDQYVESKEQQEQRLRLRDTILKLFDSKDGEFLLESMQQLFNDPTDLTNPNANYMRDGKLFVLEWIKMIIKNAKEQK